MSSSIAQKLVAVFGIGQTIIATHTEVKVTFSDKNTQLSFDQTDEVRQPAGIYDVTVEEARGASPAEEEAEVSYVINQVFRSALPEATAAAGKMTKTSAKQSPSDRFDAPSRPLR
ncbi:hypothetical protein [Ralstonia phage RP12]|uniref:Uncharacterized protein n=1 Tax=Ralstonia phage RP12 TaxID=1923889 RepID=A0A1L7N108_9CAUD|nr:hypothetical protein FDH28_gp239 [Ralstonia phage RP12]BAW19156.1 hypothetical protein [Ralstonia phage RP12]